MIQVGQHCSDLDAGANNRLNMNAGHTISSCTELCRTTFGCVGFAFGRASTYLNRCDLFQDLGCTFTTTLNFDFYEVDFTYDIEYEVEKNSVVKPYFLWGLSPYPNSCIQNCKVNLKLTVDGGTPCSIVWGTDPTTVNTGRFFTKQCTVSNAGLGSNR